MLRQFRAIQIFVDGLKANEDFTVDSCAVYTAPCGTDVFCAWVINNGTGNRYMIDTIGDGFYTVNGSFDNNKKHQKQIGCEDLNELFEAIDETHERYFC